MTLKSAMSSVGNGLLSATTAMHNAAIENKLEPINVQIAELQAQKAKLEGQLIK